MSGVWRSAVLRLRPPDAPGLRLRPPDAPGLRPPPPGLKLRPPDAPGFKLRPPLLRPPPPGLRLRPLDAPVLRLRPPDAPGLKLRPPDAPGLRLRPPGPAPWPRPPARGVHVGLRFSLSRAFSARDVEQFALLTGDSNPLHTDAAFARRSAFGRRVVHGVLVTALLSAVLGTRLPGCVFLQQRLRFPAPLLLGEEVTAHAEVRRVKMGVARIGVRCAAKEKVVLEGEVMVMLPTEEQ